MRELGSALRNVVCMRGVPDHGKGILSHETAALRKRSGGEEAIDNRLRVSGKKLMRLKEFAY